MSDRGGWYNEDVDTIREREYPMLKDATYLDHAGTTLYAKSLIDHFATSMTASLYGNPHSGSASSLLSSKTIDNVRLRALQFFKADPDEFDLVFVANATAAIKLVTEGFKASQNGFSYLYHRDSHTSLVGVRESATEAQCFESDEAVSQWLRVRGDSQAMIDEMMTLFAYPAQSNMNGRRLAPSWARSVRKRRSNTYTLLDAAALVSTAQLDLSDPDQAPDFTALSFYKIFGFPDLGALIVRKSSSHILTSRRYFGGGTVETVSCVQEQWHISKDRSIHEQLEDGTLPIHNILALESAFDVHSRLYGSMDRISRHTTYLSQTLYQNLIALKHYNGKPVCTIYTDGKSNYGTAEQGPVIAFNIKDSEGNWVANSEVEKIASIKNIHLRIGSLCNPGGIAHHLDLTPWELKANFAAGQRCSDNDLGVGGKPRGVIRVSLGAMSNKTDIATLIDFVREFFVEETDPQESQLEPARENPLLYVESLTVYPIKSCSGWSVPAETFWEVKKEGLEYDREWCLVHSGTGRVLSQKRYPRMALLKPEVDRQAGVLRVHLREHGHETTKSISVPLSFSTTNFRSRSSELCSSSVGVIPYSSLQISDFFSSALGVPCSLARFPTSPTDQASTRHAKPHLQTPQVPRKRRVEEDALSIPGAFPTPPPSPGRTPHPVLLSNESPILCITRPSLDALNHQLALKGSKPVQHTVFRANIVIASFTTPCSAYLEDNWNHLKIGESGAEFEMLGKCQRCSMVCVNQETAERSQEPFVTLAKTRRFDNKVYFGEHMCLAAGNQGKVFIKAGDKVGAFEKPAAGV